MSLLGIVSYRIPFHGGGLPLCCVGAVGARQELHCCTPTRLFYGMKNHSKNPCVWHASDYFHALNVEDGDCRW
jgi:hypothetical protein